MLFYDPSFDNSQLYLFTESDRYQSSDQLMVDVPKLLSDKHQGCLQVDKFYEEVYNMTPAHSDDLATTLISSPEIEVKTKNGGTRRSASQIDPSDTIIRIPQIVFPF